MEYIVCTHSVHIIISYSMFPNRIPHQKSRLQNIMYYNNSHILKGILKSLSLSQGWAPRCIQMHPECSPRWLTEDQRYGSDQTVSWDLLQCIGPPCLCTITMCVKLGCPDCSNYTKVNWATQKIQIQILFSKVFLIDPVLRPS